MSETRIVMPRVQLALCRDPNVRAWRNAVGFGYLPDGSPVTFGLCPDSPDLIGFKSVVITPEMVGQRVAIFLGVEVKTQKGRLSAGQRKFLAMLEQHGAIAFVARGEEDVERHMQDD